MDLDDLRPRFRPRNPLGYVYHTVFTHPTTGQIFRYLGQHLGSKLDRRYSGSGIRLGNLIARYGRNGNTKVYVVAWATNQAELNAKEIHYIREAKRLWKDDCLNLSYGGEGGRRHKSVCIKQATALRALYQTPEGARLRQRQSDWGKGRPKSEQHKRKIGAAHKGKTITVEAKAKASATLKAKPLISCPHCDVSGVACNMRRWHFDNCLRSPNYSHKDDPRARMSRALTGRTISQAHRDKLSVSVAAQPIVTCPHCGTTGKTGPMKQWHFDNCKAS